MEPANLTAALAYARLGWHVFPLKPKSKEPWTPNGFKNASTDEAIIRGWFKAMPTAGIAVATGLLSNLTVIDIDPRHDGPMTLQGLEGEYGPLPSTVESITGGGGRHIFFAYNGEPCSFPYKGVDIKSEGGYVVLPFSFHPTGVKYHWKPGCDPGDLPIPLSPDWIKPSEEEDPLPQPAPPTTDRVIPSGERNASLMSLAGTMQRRGMSHNSILRAILAENDARCVPPLPLGEVEALCQSVTRYDPNKHASPGQPPARRALSFSDVLTMQAEDPPPIDWLLPSWLAQGDVAMISGVPGVGKSWVVLDLALSQGLGLATMGYFPASPPRKVLLIDEENTPDEMWRRLRRLTLSYGTDTTTLSKHLSITQGCQGFSFRDEAYVTALMEHIRKVQPDIVIMDSLIAISDIKDENTATDVRKFIHDRLYPIRAVSNATILLVHHTSKAAYVKDRMVDDAGLVRGSIDMIGGPDASFLIDKGTGPGERVLSALKVRRGVTPPKVIFSLTDTPTGGLRPLVQTVGATNSGPSAEVSKAQRCRTQILLTFASRSSLTQAETIADVLTRDTSLTGTSLKRSLAELLKQGLLEKSERFYSLKGESV